MPPASRCEIDGLAVPLEQPGSVAELADLVRQARAVGSAIYPVGGGTRLGYGLPPGRPGTAVGMTRLAQVIDYPARDMTITVAAGITVGELRRLLAREKQRLPVDVPVATSATLGGILATNESGARRRGWGTLRDYVIGIAAVNDEGHEIKAGGRVVKNVAGYDLCKLFIGSLGTLGIITQATLKVVPLPEQDALVVMHCGDAELAPLLDRIHESRTRPVAVEVLSTAAAQVVPGTMDGPAHDPWTVLVGYEGNAAAVAWQVQQLTAEVDGEHRAVACSGPAALPLWQALEDLPTWPESAVTLKLTVAPSRCGELCRWLATQAPGVAIQAHAGNGIVIAHLPAATGLEQAQAVVAQSRQWVGAGEAVVVMRCPTPWKQAVSVWGPPRGDIRLMRAVKDRLDPQRIFNPGRFVDGI